MTLRPAAEAAAELPISERSLRALARWHAAPVIRVDLFDGAEAAAR